MQMKLIMRRYGLNISVVYLSPFILLYLLFHGYSAMGQQLPQYTLMQQNPYNFNSAAAGMNNTLEVMASYRSQWQDLPGNPTQYLLSGHLPVYKYNSSIGFLYESDNIGPESWDKIGASIGYVQPTPIGLFSLSGRVFYEQIGFKGSELISGEGNYEGNVIDHKDPLLPNSDMSSPGMRMDIGAWFKSSAYQVGISYNGIYHSGFLFEGVETYTPAGVVSIYGDYNYMLIEDLELNPALLIKSDFVTLQSQLSITCKYQAYYFGAELTGYSPLTIDQLGIHAGIELNNYFSFVYQYGVGLSSLSQVHNGSHEIAIMYALGRPVGSTVLPKIIYNPRYVE